MFRTSHPSRSLNIIPREAPAVPTIAGRTVRVLLVAGAAALYVTAYSRAWPTAPVPGGDTPDYVDLAARLANGTWTEPHDRLPGYPLLLLAFTGARAEPSRSLFYVQLLMHAAAAGLFALALRRLGGRPAACVALALVLLLPPFVDVAAFIQTECFAGFLLAGMAYSLVRWLVDRLVAFAWLAGLFAAMAFLVRPVYLLLGPATAILVLFASGRKRRLQAAAALALPSLLFCGGFVGVNYAKFGYLGLTPKSGFMLFTRTLDVLERIPDDHAQLRELLIRNRDRSLTKRDSSHTGTQFMWEGGLDELVSTTGKSKAQLAPEMLKVNLGLIRGAPLHYLHTVAGTTVECWFPSPTALSELGLPILHLVWVVMQFTLLALYALALCYSVAMLVIRAAGNSDLLRAPGLHPATAAVEAFGHLSLWYTAVFSSMVEVGDPRYLRPALPLLVLVVFLFVIRFRALRRQSAARPAHAAEGAMAARRYSLERFWNENGIQP